MEGLESVQTIKNDITIWKNHSLTSLKGIDNFDPQYVRNIDINDNPLLSHCAVESICQYLMTDTANVSDNAFGCSSMAQILSNCLVAVKDPIEENEVIFYPNPTSGKMDVKGIEIEPTKIRVTDSKGIIVIDWNKTNDGFDFTRLPAGIYFMTIQSNQQVIVKRIIKD